MLRKIVTAAFAAALAIALSAPVVYAQKALVYCPVGVDASGCDRIVTALQSRFTDGVDRGYDGSNGTVDLKSVDLQHYGVFVVPSLADDAIKQPYAMLRSVASRLRFAINGRVAVYSGAPDQGRSNRTDKDALIQNLTSWAANGHSRATGLVGLVAFLDLSEQVGNRYSWVRDISLADVSADAELQAFSDVTPVSARGGNVLSAGGAAVRFANMASYGLHIGRHAAARTEVGALGGGSKSQSVLVMYSNADGKDNATSGATTGQVGASGASLAVTGVKASLSTTAGTASTATTSGPAITTDKPDYQPGDTVTFTGTGFAPGDTVTITVHEDPTWSYPDRQFTSVADGNGAFVNRQMVVVQQDLGVTFTATAVGNPSGLVAQTTFTDGITSATAPGYFATAGSPAVCTATALPTSGIPGVSAKTNINTAVCVKATITTNSGNSNGNDVDVVWFSPTSTVAFTTHIVNQPSSSTTPIQDVQTPNVGGVWTVKLCAAGTTTPCNNAGNTFSTSQLEVIAKQNQTISFVAPSGTTYGDADFDLGATATSGLSVSYASTTLSICTFVSGKLHIVAAGSCSVTASQAGDATYNAAPDVSQTFSIAKASLTVTAPNFTVTYGDPVPSPITPNITGFVNSEGTAALSTVPTCTTTYTPTSSAGSAQTTSCAGGAASNYSFTYVGGTVTVNKRTASVTSVAASKTYGDADPTLTTTNSGFLAGDVGAGKITFSATRAPGETVAGSPYAITPAANDNGTGLLDNYAVTPTTAGFTITPKAASVTPNAEEKTYGDADPTLTGTLSGFVAGDNVTANYTRTAGENVGGSPYTISATLSPAGVLGNYTITYNTASFTIKAKAASVTPNPATKVYGAADPVFGGILAGFLPADNVSATYTRSAGETVLGGPYTISAALSPAGVLSNYTVTYNTAQFTITPKPASVTPNAASKTYGDPDPALSGTLSGFVAADNVTPSYGRTAGESVLGGPYTISATLAPAGVLSNYTITYNTANFTINKRPATVAAVAASKTYGDADPTLTTTNSGFLAGDVGAGKITFSATRAPGETVAGSPYAITPAANDNGTGLLDNYAVTPTTAGFTINKRLASVTPNAASKTYGDLDPALGGTLSNFVPADGVTATYSRTTGETVAGSPYTIGATLSPAGVLDNYTITYHTANFTINPKAASVTPNAKSKDYGDADPVFDGTLAGFLAADAVTATYTRAPSGDAPTTNTSTPVSYTISATLSPAGVLGNYAITYNTASFTINNDTPAITSLTGPLAPVPVGSPVTVTGAFSDHGFTGDTYTITSVWTDGSNTLSVPSVGAATYNASSGTFSITAPNNTPAGVYTVTVKVKDRWDALSAPATVTGYVVVFDPNGGFVTGGGWITADPGSCNSQYAPSGVCTNATGGRANFGFVSKYQKGANVPSGNTEFQFQAGNLNFKSTSYQWLVISGPQAQYKGTGTINGGATTYNFILTAVDGSIPGGGGADKFRIKITDLVGNVVFDNQVSGDTSDSATPSTALGGGDITIHTK